jgi:SLOG cluster2
MEKFLKNKNIAISISASEDLNKLGFSDTHIKDAMTEFARHLLVQGASLVYGGDLRPDGFTETLSELMHEYWTEEKKTFPFKNYVAYPIHLKIDNVEKNEYKSKKVTLIEVEPEESLKIETPQFVNPDTPENNYIWAKCLTKMRHLMNNEIDARIVVGGKNYSYKGKYSGIIEEAQIAIASQKPVYLVGAFGGATHNMIQAISENKDVIDSKKPFYLNTDYEKFKTHYNNTSTNEKIDFEELNQFFKNLNIDDLNNGLDKEDNERLFITPHIPEIVYLVLKGLRERLNS